MTTYVASQSGSIECDPVDLAGYIPAWANPGALIRDHARKCTEDGCAVCALLPEVGGAA